MAAESSQRRVTCYFGILNLGGLMEMENHYQDTGVLGHSQIKNPVFSTQSYTIKTTFNRNLKFRQKDQNDRFKTTENFGKLYFPTEKDNPYNERYYQKKFRRQVLWDFGDGTKIQGYSAEHAYKKPGRYKITCTFFDINRRSWVNNYQIYVVVKQVLPTILRFDELYTKKELKCSKIERVVRLQALNSNTVQQQLKIKCNRIFNQQQHKSNYEQIGKTFSQLPDITFRFMEKYWNFLQSDSELFYNTQRVYSNDLSTSNLATPTYVNLYGRFFYDEQNDKLDLSLYQVIPYKNIDLNLTTIKLLDPNKSILQVQEDGTPKQYTTIHNVTQLYITEQIPQGVFYLGRRGFCDIFYKNDFIGHDNVLNFIYDIQDFDVTGQSKTSVNYLNINPIGCIVKVIPNDVENVKIGLSCDGFLHQLGQDTFNTNKNYYVDTYLYNTLYKGIDMDVYIFPYICYNQQFYIQGADDLVIDVNQGGIQPQSAMYYVPKDLSLSLSYVPILSKNQGNSSFVNHGLSDALMDSTLLQQKVKSYIIGINPWFYRVPIILQDYINIKFNVGIKGTSVIINPFLTKFKLKSSHDIILPQRIKSYQDIDKLIDVYMSHPMFNQTDNLKDAFRSIFGGGMLTKILTSSDYFIDDVSNVKTCYLSNFIATLKMLGQDVTQFEKNTFDGVNDVRDLVRVLSMNHSDLIGHLVVEQFDIEVKNDAKGKHVGDEIYVNDTLYLNVGTKENRGCVTAIRRANNDKVFNISVQGGVNLIVNDRYTGESRIVKFYKDDNTQIPSSVKLGQYDSSWGWNLLLPDSFNNINEKIRQNDKKILNVDGIYSQSMITKFKSENERLEKMKAELVSGYYRFFLLDDSREIYRNGNFLSRYYITPQIQSVQQWDKEWGIRHDYLMKILLQNCFLNNNRFISGIYEDGITQQIIPQYVTSGRIQQQAMIQNVISYQLKVNNRIDSQMDVTGSVILQGDVQGVGKNELVIYLKDAMIDNYASFEMRPSAIQVHVNFDGSISSQQHEFLFSGNNVFGKLEVTITGTVENPIIVGNMMIQFIDERMYNNIQFNSSNTICEMKDVYYTNIKRQQIDSMAIQSGIVDSTKPMTNDRFYTARIIFDNDVKLGLNVCSLQYDYFVGNTTYTRFDGTVTTSKNNNRVRNTIYPLSVVIESDGQIRFADGVVTVPIQNGDNGQLMQGQLKFELSGNAVLNTHKLHCSTSGIKTMLVEIGGYSFVIDKPMIETNINENVRGSLFLVNGEDGFEQGYKIHIKSIGQVIDRPVTNLSTTATIQTTILNANDQVVYTNTKHKDHFTTVDQNAYISQKDFIIRYEDDLTGSIAITTYRGVQGVTHGGYYDIVGFDVNLQLK